MIELFQITGSSSFAAQAALEEAGAEYVAVDVHPRRREEAPGSPQVAPLRRVPAIRDGEVVVTETGAVLLWIADRFPDAGLAPAVGDPARADLYRWVMWTANTLHTAWAPLFVPELLTDEETAFDGLRAKARTALERHGDHLERALAGREWLAGERFSVADISVFMLVGWQHAIADLVLGGPAVEARFTRVGARPGVTRARALDGLDDRLVRHDPHLRGGKPIA